MQLSQIVIQSIEELLATLSYPFGKIFDPSIPFHSKEKQTILIVERWFDTNGLHKLWVQYLTDKGFAVNIVNFPIQHGSFDQSAQKLKDYIEKYDLNNIVLVGISGGGLTAYLYLQHHNGWKRVRKFISIGTPFKGTPMAAWISFVSSGKEELPGSSLIKKLYQEEVKHSEKIVCLAARFDELVLPQSANFLPGVRHITLDILGHNNFHLDAKNTYDTVARLAKE